MSQHVPDDLLLAFVDGDVDEQVAVHIAEHLDHCPACATRATGHEPLATAFASVRDPLPPAGLAAAILARADEPERLPMRELWFGGGLLAAACGLLVFTEGPIRLVAELATVTNAAVALGRGLTVAVSPFQVSLLLGTFVTLVGSLATLHLASTHLLDGREILRRIQ
jgi:anti-sigma factor RsiW